MKISIVLVITYAVGPSVNNNAAIRLAPEIDILE